MCGTRRPPYRLIAQSKNRAGCEGCRAANQRIHGDSEYRVAAATQSKSWKTPPTLPRGPKDRHYWVGGDWWRHAECGCRECTEYTHDDHCAGGGRATIDLPFAVVGAGSHAGDRSRDVRLDRLADYLAAWCLHHPKRGRKFTCSRRPRYS